MESLMKSETTMKFKKNAIIVSIGNKPVMAACRCGKYYIMPTMIM